MNERNTILYALDFRRIRLIGKHKKKKLNKTKNTQQTYIDEKNEEIFYFVSNKFFFFFNSSMQFYWQLLRPLNGTQLKLSINGRKRMKKKMQKLNAGIFMTNLTGLLSLEMHRFLREKKKEKKN